MNSEQLVPRLRGGLVVSAVCICAFAFVGQAIPGLAQADSKAQTAPPATGEPKAAASDGKGAAPSAEVDVQNSPEYRELIDQALSEFKHKNWPEARVLFRRAHELSPNARTARGVGIVSYEMRDYVQAVLALTIALADTRQPLTESQKKECSGLLTRARTFVGSYSLVLEPTESEVSLDGAAPVRDPDGRVLVPFGEHTLQASAPGYQTSTSKFSVQGGERGELRVVLYKQGVELPNQGAPVAQVEKTVEQPAPGGAAGSGSAGSGELGRTGGLRYTWVALGASAAFGAGAAGLWFAGQGKLDDLSDSCRETRCEEGSVDTASVKRFERATNAMLGLSAGALVTAVVLAAFEWPRERKLALDLSPRQLSIRGSF